jgi:hypothetical protein
MKAVKLPPPCDDFELEIYLRFIRCFGVAVADNPTYREMRPVIARELAKGRLIIMRHWHGWPIVQIR